MVKKVQRRESFYDTKRKNVDFDGEEEKFIFRMKISRRSYGDTEGMIRNSHFWLHFQHFVCF